MLDPRSTLWMNQFLPSNAQIPISRWDDPKTLTEIKTELRHAGLDSEEPLTIKTAQRATDLLLPIVRRNSDSSIVELRVYRAVPRSPRDRQEVFQLVNQLDVRPLEESFVTAPVMRAKGEGSASDRVLPFTTFKRLQENAPNNGIWLTLTGKLRQADTTIAYGQVFYYNPTTTAMRVMLPWTSPTNELPQWQKVPKGRAAELVVNQTIGLEPAFQTYQVRPSKRSKTIPVQLQAISLTQPAIDYGAFVDALLLARSGLWSSSLEIMQSVKHQLPSSEWTTQAQAQLDLVARHAKITKTQADQPWASTDQQVFADLVDGRWAGAMQALQKSPTELIAVLDVLKFDSGRIQKRISTALQLNSARSDVQSWAALRLAAKQGKDPAIAWLNQQPKDSTVLRNATLKLLNEL